MKKLLTIILFFTVLLIGEDSTSYSWSMVQEVIIDSNFAGFVWSEPTPAQSSRLKYYVQPAPEFGKNALVTVDAVSQNIFLDADKANGHDAITRSGKAIIRNTITNNGVPVTQTWEGGKFEFHYQILDLNKNVISEVKFNKPDVEMYCMFDDGQYIGVDYQIGLLHIVIPKKNIYSVVPIFEDKDGVGQVQKVL